MPKVRVEIQDKVNEILAYAENEQQAVLVYQKEYQAGDSIVIKVDKRECFYVIRIDDTMDEALVYMTANELHYKIPFEEQKASYNPKSFAGALHYLTVREAKDIEINHYRNLAKNVIDQHGDHGCYPHAWANVETRNESVFAARNAIDGVLANDYHGIWPYESWGINMQDDAEFTLDFGRPVDISEIILYTRAHFPHDNWWIKAAISFSDGTKEVVLMEKSIKPHCFSIEKKGIRWLRLHDLIKADDPSPFPALTQIEVYGTESKQIRNCEGY